MPLVRQQTPKTIFNLLTKNPYLQTVSVNSPAQTDQIEMTATVNLYTDALQKKFQPTEM